MRGKILVSTLLVLACLPPPVRGNIIHVNLVVFARPPASSRDIIHVNYGSSRSSSLSVPGDNGHDNTGGSCPSPCAGSQVNVGCPRPSSRATPPAPTADPRLPNAPVDIYALLRPLSYDERAVCASSLQLASYRYALKVGDTQVATDYFGCLRGCEWLFDTVINAFTELLNACHWATSSAPYAYSFPSDLVHVFLTFMYACVRDP